MSTDFGWWRKTDEDGKFQVRAEWHGGKIAWKRKQGHHTPWKPHVPTADDWDQLFYEGDKRVTRRLISPKQFEAMKRLRK